MNYRVSYFEANKTVNLPQSISVPKLGNQSQYFFGGSNPSLPVPPLGMASASQSASSHHSNQSSVTSDEVKQRLKNVILQKLNRTGNSVANLPVVGLTTPKSAIPHSGQPMFFHNHSQSYGLQQRTQAASYKPYLNHQLHPGMSHDQPQSGLKQPMPLSPLQKTIEEEQSLRRTTSEPNLKVEGGTQFLQL